MSEQVDVVIAGGGLVGLCAAAFMAKHGLKPLVLERLTESSPLPRAAFYHMRTLEMFRELGIERLVRERSALEFAPEGAIIAMDCLAGRKTADIIGNLNAGVDEVSPCRRLFLNQPSLEPILRDRARELGATVRQGMLVTAVGEDAHGLTVTAVDTGRGTEHTLRCAYLVAADGARSQVRQSLGIGLEGRDAFSHSVTIYFTADLSRFIGEHAWSLIYVNNPQLRGFFRLNRSSQAGFLAVNVVGDPAVDPHAATNAATDVSPARLLQLLRAGVGDPGIDLRIDGYTRWRASAQIAQRMRRGRIFLAGDAAHLMPPTGGFGGNTGVHDAHNLAWKLAAVLSGAATPALLDTYDGERRPAAGFTVEQAFSRYAYRTAPWMLQTEHPQPIVEDLQIELGCLYGSPLGLHADPRLTRGVPGSRAPHLWLELEGRRCSTIDLAGSFALLAGPSGGAWLDAAQDLAPRLGRPGLRAVDMGRCGAAAREDFGQHFNVRPDGAVLLRPDSYVAKRWVGASADPRRELGAALRAVLSPESPGPPGS